jgi:hypothetical protein
MTEDEFYQKLWTYAMTEMGQAMGLQNIPWVTRLVNSVALEAARLHEESKTSSLPGEVSDALHRVSVQVLATAGRVIADVGPSQDHEEGQRAAREDLDLIARHLVSVAIQPAPQSSGYGPWGVIDDCDCLDREALVTPEGLVCGTCGKQLSK